MEARYGMRGQEPFEGVKRFEAENLEIGLIRAVGEAADLPGAAEQAFDPEKPPFGVVPGHFEEKRAVPAPEINLQGGVVREYFVPLQTAKVVLRHELGGLGEARNRRWKVLGGAHAGVLACRISKCQGESPPAVARVPTLGILNREWTRIVANRT